MPAAFSQHLKRLRVHEIACKPLNPLNIDDVLEEESVQGLSGNAMEEALNRIIREVPFVVEIRVAEAWA